VVEHSDGPVDVFRFFHPVNVTELGDAVPQTPWDFSLCSLKRQGHAGLGLPQPDLPFTSLQSALRLRPRRALSSAGAHQGYQRFIPKQETQTKVHF
jgi:hypothetical protein